MVVCNGREREGGGESKVVASLLAIDHHLASTIIPSSAVYDNPRIKKLVLIVNYRRTWANRISLK